MVNVFDGIFTTRATLRITSLKEMLNRTLSTTFNELFCELVLECKVILKNTTGPDNTCVNELPV